MTTTQQPTTETGKTLAEELSQARQELLQLYNGLRAGNVKSDELKVSAITDQFVNFQANYQARLTAGRVLGGGLGVEEMLLTDIAQYLHNLTAVLDDVLATRPASATDVNLERAYGRYNRRAGILESTQLELRQALAKATPTRGAPVAGLSDKGEQELLRIVTRAIPVDPQLDDEVTTLLLHLVRGADTEPTTTALAPALAPQERYEELRALANAQAFREEVGAAAAPLFKRLLDEKNPPQAFEDVFRNAYFTVINSLHKYYRTRPAEPTISPTPASQSTPPAAPTAPAQPTQTPEPAPLITETQAEDVTDDTPSSSPTNPNIQGTGLR